MFNLHWSEILLIALVLIVVVGPRDLPIVLRSIGKFIRRIRGYFHVAQMRFEEVAGQSELGDVYKGVRQVTNLDEDTVASMPEANPNKDDIQDDRPPSS